MASRVLAYANEVFSGARNYLLDLPVVPGTGAIGRLRAFGPDATRLAIGDWVDCDPTVRSRDDAQTPDITLRDLNARGEGGLRLQQHFCDDAFAERIRVLTERHPHRPDRPSGRGSVVRPRNHARALRRPARG